MARSERARLLVSWYGLFGWFGWFGLVGLVWLVGLLVGWFGLVWLVGLLLVGGNMTNVASRPSGELLVEDLVEANGPAARRVFGSKRNPKKHSLAHVAVKVALLWEDDFACMCHLLDCVC